MALLPDHLDRFGHQELGEDLVVTVREGNVESDPGGMTFDPEIGHRRAEVGEIDLGLGTAAAALALRPCDGSSMPSSSCRALRRRLR